MTTINDPWSLVHYPELTNHENEIIRIARRMGFDKFFPSVPNATAQAVNTYIEAKKFLSK